MTVDEFRTLARAQPEAVESAHFGQPDFRVGNKIFAGLDRSNSLGTLKLTPEDQSLLIEACGNAAFPAAGSWGAKGWTKIALADVSAADLGFWMQRAWHITAPPSLLRRHDIVED
ncbi:MAG: MmcQ/YjbR family DNA-binding protein [Albidovulum sp.]